MDNIARHILGLPGWAALVIVFAVPLLESSAFVGFVFPGEIAVLLGGVLAFQHRVGLPAVLAAAIARGVPRRHDRVLGRASLRPASAAVVLVLLVGASQIYLGAYWLTDVLAGYALGATWLAMLAALHRRARGLSGTGAATRCDGTAPARRPADTLTR